MPCGWCKTSSVWWALFICLFFQDSLFKHFKSYSDYFLNNLIFIVDTSGSNWREFSKDGKELPLLYSVLSLPAQLLSHVWLFVTPWTVACQAPLSMGILQARILEWVAIPFSRGSSPPRDWTHFCFFCIGRRVLYRLSHLGNPIISLLWVKWEFISINGKKTTHCLSMLRPSLIGSGMEKCKGISGEPNKMNSNWANPGVQEEYWEVLDSEEGQCILRFLSQVCPYCSLPLLTLSTDPTLIHPTSISPECDCPAWLPCPQSHPTASFWQRSQWWFKK